MDIETVLARIGGFGRAQKKIFYSVSFLQSLCAVHLLSLPFIGTDPGWSCRAKTAQGTWEPVADSEKCSNYERGECTPEYSKEFTSIVSEWNLICNRSSLPNLSQSGLFLGQLAGLWLFGVMSDRFGRRRIFFFAVLTSFLSGLGYSLSTDFYTFTLFRVLLAFFMCGVTASYVLCMEIVGPSHRNYATLAYHGFFALGYVLLAVLAYYIRQWRVLCTVASVSLLAFLSLWRLIPESPRWLLVNGREDEARHVLEGMARDNGTQLPPCELKRPESHSKERSVSMVDLLRGRNIRHRTIVLFWAWFANCMTYYGLTLNTGNLGGDRYISFALSGLVEIPSFILANYLLDRVGRKWTHAGFLFAGGLSCLLWTLMYWAGSSENLKMVLALTGKFAVSGSMGIIYLYTTELFPTQVRNFGLAAGNLGARIGGFLSPVLLLMGQYSASLPMLSLGVVSVSIAVFTLSLPETLNRPMPETLKDLDG